MKCFIIPAFTCVLFSSSSFAGYYEFDTNKVKIDPYRSPVERNVDDSFEEDADLSIYPEDLMTYKTPYYDDYEYIIKNQKDRGSSSFFSVLQLVEAVVWDQPRYIKGFPPNFSEEYFIWATKYKMGSAPYMDGGDIFENAMAIKKYGVIFEEDLPYQSSWFKRHRPCENYFSEEDVLGSTLEIAPENCFSHLPPPEAALSKVIKLDSLEFESFPSDSAHIVKSIALITQPVVTSVVTHTKLLNNFRYDANLLNGCKNTPTKDCGTHTILITGYNTSDRVFYFNNSWGQKWGKKGRGEISFDYIDNFSTQKNALTAFLTKPTKLPFSSTDTYKGLASTFTRFKARYPSNKDIIDIKNSPIQDRDISIKKVGKTYKIPVVPIKEMGLRAMWILEIKHTSKKDKDGLTKIKPEFQEEYGNVFKYEIPILTDGSMDFYGYQITIPKKAVERGVFKKRNWSNFGYKFTMENDGSFLISDFDDYYLNE